MRTLFPATILLLILLQSIPLYPQTNSTNEKGELTLNNSEVLKGYIWITDNLGGPLKVFYRPTVYSPSTEFSSQDIVSISLDNGERLIESWAIPTDAGIEKKLVEVQLKGNLSFVSRIEAGQKYYYIINSEGEVTELINSYNIPGQAGRYDLKFNEEYKEAIRSLLIDKGDYRKAIESIEYSPKSISRLLIKYHVANRFDYTVYPPPPYSVFIGGGASVMSMKHSSDINPEFVSVSPFAGITLVAGLKILGNRLELSYEPSLLYGIIYHDNSTKDSLMVKSYFEDIARTTILSNTLYISANPLPKNKIAPLIGIGISYNNYLSYSREVTEELLFEDMGLVLNNYYDDFEKPGSYFGASARAGLIYELGNGNSARLVYTFNIYGDKAGPKQIHAATISYIHNIH